MKLHKEEVQTQLSINLKLALRACPLPRSPTFLISLVIIMGISSSTDLNCLHAESLATEEGKREK